MPGPAAPYGSNIGGEAFRGAWKPWGYNIPGPTNQYKASNPMWGYAGTAVGFGATLLTNPGFRAAAGGVIGGMMGGPVGAVEGAGMGAMLI